MGAPWAVLGTATLPQTPPGFIKASTWLTKPGVPCANFPHTPVQHPPCLAGHHPPPLLPYQEEAVLPKHLPKTLKLSGYCAAAGPALWGPAPCTSHSHYLGLFSFIAERLLRVGNKALTAVLSRPGVGERLAS